jgi:hypothetical protein
VAARESLQTVPEGDRERIGRLTEGPTPPGLPRAYRLRNRADLILLPAGRYRVAYAVGDEDEAITVIDIVARGRLCGRSTAPSPHDVLAPTVVDRKALRCGISI